MVGLDLSSRRAWFSSFVTLGSRAFVVPWILEVSNLTISAASLLRRLREDSKALMISSVRRDFGAREKIRPLDFPYWKIYIKIN